MLSYFLCLRQLYEIGTPLLKFGLLKFKLLKFKRECTRPIFILIFKRNHRFLRQLVLTSPFSKRRLRLKNQSLKSSMTNYNSKLFQCLNKSPNSDTKPKVLDSGFGGIGEGSASTWLIPGDEDEVEEDDIGDEDVQEFDVMEEEEEEESKESKKRGTDLKICFEYLKFNLKSGT